MVAGTLTRPIGFVLGGGGSLGASQAGMLRALGGPLAQARTLRRTRTHLFPSSGLAAVITRFLGAATTFADLALPFRAVTTDLATAAPYLITTGPLLPTLLASAAIPAIYPRVDYDGRRLCDGGLAANVPMRQALAMGARSLVVLDGPGLYGSPAG